MLTDLDRLLTLDEVGDVLRVTKRSVYRLHESGSLPFVHIRTSKSEGQGHPRVRTSDLAAFIAGLEVA